MYVKRVALFNEDSSLDLLFTKKMIRYDTEVEFVHPVSADGSVKFVASSVNFSMFTHFLCFFLLKRLKLGEIDDVRFLALKSGGVKFWTNSMSAPTQWVLLTV